MKVTEVINNCCFIVGCFIVLVVFVLLVGCFVGFSNFSGTMLNFGGALKFSENPLVSCHWDTLWR